MRRIAGAEGARGGAQVAIKFEHHSSKGCPGGGPPNEWAVYQALGETHGIPRLYFKGSLADFYIMARRPPPAPSCKHPLRAAGWTRPRWDARAVLQPASAQPLAGTGCAGL